jgi:DNA-directed RNA polymerase subunit L
LLNVQEVAQAHREAQVRIQLQRNSMAARQAARKASRNVTKKTGKIRKDNMSLWD